jgi:predicted phosphohydrolase
MLTPVAPLLLIAGDICSAWKAEYASFLKWCSQRWRFVVVIAGNHEYFCDDAVRTMDETDAEIRRITTMLGNVLFLQNGESVSVDGVRIIGATLWSAVDPAIHEAVLTKGDYTMTYTGTPYGVRNTTPMDICALHALQKAFLHSSMALYPREKIVLMTHHLPSFSFQDEEHRGGPFRSCYASADDDLLIRATAVVCGHSHQTLRLRLPTGGLAVINARGYPKDAGRWKNPYSATATLRV